MIPFLRDIIKNAPDDGAGLHLHFLPPAKHSKIDAARPRGAKIFLTTMWRVRLADGHVITIAVKLFTARRYKQWLAGSTPLDFRVIGVGPLRLLVAVRDIDLDWIQF